jgi:hypothetical protein
MLARKPEWKKSFGGLRSYERNGEKVNLSLAQAMEAHRVV